MMISCKIELHGVDIDFDENKFVDSLKEFIENDEQTCFTQGELKVKSSNYTIIASVGD